MRAASSGQRVVTHRSSVVASLPVVRVRVPYDSFIVSLYVSDLLNVTIVPYDSAQSDLVKYPVPYDCRWSCRTERTSTSTKNYSYNHFEKNEKKLEKNKREEVISGLLSKRKRTKEANRTRFHYSSSI